MANLKQWYAGVDWAWVSHHVFLSRGCGRKIGERVIRHRGEGLAEMAARLTATSGAARHQPEAKMDSTTGPCGTSIACATGSFWRNAIRARVQAARDLDLGCLAGAKDGSRDAESNGLQLAHDRRRCWLLAVVDPVVIELREWSRTELEPTSGPSGCSTSRETVPA